MMMKQEHVADRQCHEEISYDDDESNKLLNNHNQFYAFLLYSCQLHKVYTGQQSINIPRYKGNSKNCLTFAGIKSVDL